MSFIDNVRRIVREDYDQKYHALIDKLAFVLNTFMEQVVTEVNGQIDFTNLAQDKIGFSITVDADGIPVTTTLVRSTVSRATGFTIIRALNQTNLGTYATNQPFVSFSVQTDTTLMKINHVSGLQAGEKYSLTAIVY